MGTSPGDAQPRLGPHALEQEIAKTAPTVSRVMIRHAVVFLEENKPLNFRVDSAAHFNQASPHYSCCETCRLVRTPAQRVELLAATLAYHKLHWHEGDPMLLNLRADWNETEALIYGNSIQA